LLFGLRFASGGLGGPIDCVGLRIEVLGGAQPGRTGYPMIWEAEADSSKLPKRLKSQS
jgi:hypothetical protein